MRIFITGGTGLVGTALVHALRIRGDQPIVLSRRAPQAAQALGSGVEVVQGDPAEEGEWLAAVDGCQAAVNLAGEPLFGKRWNERQKAALRSSRVDATRNLRKAIAQAAQPPAVLVSSSAIGYYGDVSEGEVTESSPSGDDFLAELCRDWERAAIEGPPEGLRTTIVRIGVVLARDGGALKQMLTPFKLGVGGPVGNGRQWMSWIHLQDLARIFLLAIDDARLHGPVNATAPHPVRNKEFSKILARTLGRPCLFPIPPLALRLRFGEVAQVVVTGQRALPRALEQAGFHFLFDRCDEALKNLLGRPTGRSPA